MNKFKLSILATLCFSIVGCGIKEEIISAPTAKYHIVEIKSMRGEEKPTLNKKGQAINELMNPEKKWRIGFFSNYETDKTKEVDAKNLYMDCPGDDTSCDVRPSNNAFLIENFGKIISVKEGKNTNETVNLEKLEVGKTLRLIRDNIEISNVKIKEPIASLNGMSRVGDIPLKVKLEIKMIKTCPAKIYKKEGNVLVNRAKYLPGYTVRSKAVWVEAFAECVDD